MIIFNYEYAAKQIHKSDTNILDRSNLLYPNLKFGREPAIKETAKKIRIN